MSVLCPPNCHCSHHTPSLQAQVAPGRASPRQPRGSSSCRRAALQSISYSSRPSTDSYPTPGANVTCDIWTTPAPRFEMLSLPKDYHSFGLCREQYVPAFSGAPCSTHYKRGRHIPSQHLYENGDLIYTHVYCQRFFRTGTCSSYFEVAIASGENAAVKNPFLKEKAQRATLSREALLHELIETKLGSSQKALEAKSDISQSTFVATEADPWLDATRWRQLFKGVPLLKAACLSHMPDSATEPDLCILTESIDRLVEQAYAAMCVTTGLAFSINSVSTALSITTRLELARGHSWSTFGKNLTERTNTLGSVFCALYAERVKTETTVKWLIFLTSSLPSS
jgi:hypothetical protein